MLPSTPNDILKTVTVVKQSQLPSRTYRMDFAAGRIRGEVDGQEAVIQAIHKILDTERFEHLIYSWNYGMEWNRVLGKSRREAESELKRALQEALTQDQRITGITRVSISPAGRSGLSMEVTAETIFGATQIERTVTI